MSVTIIDYGAGNLTSVLKALTAVGGATRLARRPDEMARASALVVPGVGHFGSTAALDAAWRAPIARHVAAGRPVLGICLGLQWLFEGSAEAPDLPGLGIFPGRCFRLSGAVKIPHVGWNTLDRAASPPSRLLDGIDPGASAYFTHAYAAPLSSSTTATTSHGSTFTAVVERGPLFGVQFHPEKSGRIGLTILANFLRLARETASPCSRAD